jgi:hypothetical protein
MWSSGYSTLHRSSSSWLAKISISQEVHSQKKKEKNPRKALDQAVFMSDLASVFSGFLFGSDSNAYRISFCSASKERGDKGR